MNYGHELTCRCFQRPDDDAHVYQAGIKTSWGTLACYFKGGWPHKYRARNEPDFCCVGRIPKHILKTRSVLPF